MHPQFVYSFLWGARLIEELMVVDSMVEYVDSMEVRACMLF